MPNRLLVVEDDRYLLDNLKRVLTGQGFEVTTASTGEQGLALVTEAKPDLLILDLGLPGMDGLTLCRRIRSRWKLPIIMLTARSESIDKVVGLEVGADDYLTKPFEPIELVARVRAQLRRANEYGSTEDEAPKPIQIGALEIDLAKRMVRRAGQPVTLTSREFDVIALLAQNAGRVMDRDTIFERAWGYEMEFNTNSLEVILYRLRKKIEERPAKPQYLHTVRGYGYKLTAP
ncbi:MAG: response regulator transcription factor [Fimbriimonadaceae bacterium]|nr:response regulator transcription factor [Fimbriimonadaceae bacterium]QYK56031.1 MAG: response regulator transcription factor [Fimbriimonadaceae bacterium]